MLEILPASSWGRNIRGNPSKIKARNIVELTVHYTGAPSVTIGKSQVAAYIKRIEAGHQAKNSSTIGYNIVIDKWGRVWEARGLGLRNAANGTKSNDTSVSVLLLCGVKDNEPTTEMLASLQALYRYLCGIYRRDLVIRPHQYHKPTACPGPRVLAIIESGIIKGDVSPVEPPKPQPVTPTPERTVTVVRGDGWWKLAAKHMGSGLKWKRLRDYNNNVALHPGVIIRIPESS